MLLKQLECQSYWAEPIANIASLADNIVTIEDGRITEAGSPGDLSQTKGYASKVGLTLPTTENLEESIPIVDNSASQVVSYEDSASINDPPLPNLSRKNGQMSVYSYYLTNVGYGASILYILFLIIWIFCTEFSSKSRSLIDWDIGTENNV